jgi:hypothetical protein
VLTSGCNVQGKTLVVNPRESVVTDGLRVAAMHAVSPKICGSSIMLPLQLLWRLLLLPSPLPPLLLSRLLLKLRLLLLQLRQ